MKVVFNLANKLQSELFYEKRIDGQLINSIRHYSKIYPEVLICTVTHVYECEH